MQRTKIYWYAGAVLAIISALLHFSNTTNGFLAMSKCLTLAFAVVILTIGILCSVHIKRRHIFWLYGLGVFIMSGYTILALDTYIFHVLTWFPGIIRYPLFSLYGIGYLLFAIIGVFLYVGSPSHDV